MRSLLFLALVASPAFGALPAKKPLAAYAPLWERSPFCASPKQEAPAPQVNPFAEWTLGGVTETAEGYRVVLFHRERAGETRVIESAKPGPLSIESVSAGGKSWKQTTVTLRSGDRVGTLSFDNDALIRPVSKAAVPQTPPAAEPPKRVRLHVPPVPPQP